MRILVIEDEAAMRTALVENLRAEKYHVISAEDGLKGLEMACTEFCDLILLDVMMPELDGFSVCRELRKREISTPVFMLTARGTVDDRVHGLDCGADDYLVKPFSLKELLARVRAIQRRMEREKTLPDEVKIGNAIVNFRERKIIRGNQAFDLTEKEWGMLRLLVTYEGEVVTREKFLDVVWGYHAFPSTRTVDNFIAELRRKIEEQAAQPRHLISVRGSGYRLVI